MTQKQNKLEYIPFGEIATITDPKQLEDWVTGMDLKARASWLWPQISAHYTTWNLIIDQNNQVDIPKSLKLNLGGNWELGLWRFVCRVPRSLTVQGQTKPEWINYSTLAPTIMMTQKRDRGIPYQRWPIEHLGRVVNNEVYSALWWAYQNQDWYRTPEQLVELRQLGLAYKTGKRQGQVRDPRTTWQLTGLPEEYKTIPKLAITMLTQIWCCHPSNRTQYIISDPWNWDHQPQPLINTEIFSQEVAAVEGPVVSDMPWDD